MKPQKRSLIVLLVLVTIIGLAFFAFLWQSHLTTEQSKATIATTLDKLPPLVDELKAIEELLQTSQDPQVKDLWRKFQNAIEAYEALSTSSDLEEIERAPNMLREAMKTLREIDPSQLEEPEDQVIIALVRSMLHIQEDGEIDPDP